jgi:hypothetical protein
VTLLLTLLLPLRKLRRLLLMPLPPRAMPLLPRVMPLLPRVMPLLPRVMPLLPRLKKPRRLSNR